MQNDRIEAWCPHFRDKFVGRFVKTTPLGVVIENERGLRYHAMKDRVIEKPLAGIPADLFDALQ